MAYGLVVPAFVMAGTGMALVFAPAANAVLSAVRPEEAGQASGANSGAGSFVSPQAYVDGLIPAVWVGAAVLALGALVALLVPGRAASAQESGTTSAWPRTSPARSCASIWSTAS